MLRKICLVPESNQRHEDFQSSALPTELTRHKIAGVGFEPTTSGYEPDELPDCSIPRYPIFVLDFSSKADDRTRTDNLLITNQLLCQLSHIGRLPDWQVGGGGFEPPKQFAADLQSVPFGHSGNHP